MEIAEKVYFDKENIKVTDVRFICKHDTILIDKIAMVDTNLKVGTLFTSIILFLLSFLSFYFGSVGILVISMCFIAVRWAYENYVELIVTVGSKKITVLTVNMYKREFLYSIADALSMALADKERKKTMPQLSETETIRLRRLLLDLEKISPSQFEIPHPSTLNQASQSKADTNN